MTVVLRSLEISAACANLNVPRFEIHGRPAGRPYILPASFAFSAARSSDPFFFRRNREEKLL
jgi:hypothetical protein